MPKDKLKKKKKAAEPGDELEAEIAKRSAAARGRALGAQKAPEPRKLFTAKSLSMIKHYKRYVSKLNGDLTKL